MREGSSKRARAWLTCLLRKLWIVVPDHWKRVGQEFLPPVMCAPDRLNVAPLPWVKAACGGHEVLKTCG